MYAVNGYTTIVIVPIHHCQPFSKSYTVALLNINYPPPGKEYSLNKFSICACVSTLFRATWR